MSPGHVSKGPDFLAPFSLLFFFSSRTLLPLPNDSPMLLSDEENQDNVQTIRHASKVNSAHIIIHQDSWSENTVILWNDVLRVFPETHFLPRGGNEFSSA